MSLRLIGAAFILTTPGLALAEPTLLPEKFLGVWEWNKADCGLDDNKRNMESRKIVVSNPADSFPHPTITDTRFDGGEPVTCSVYRFTTNGLQIKTNETCQTEEASLVMTEKYLTLNENSSTLRIGDDPDPKSAYVFNSCEVDEVVVPISTDHTVPVETKCDYKDRIWRSRANDFEWRFYTSGESSDGHHAFIEKWKNDELFLRLQGTSVCSQGASVCRVFMRANGIEDTVVPGKFKGDAIGEAVYEEIDIDEDGFPDWIVLAGLSQSLYYLNGPYFELLKGNMPESRTPIPNIYSYLGCQEESGSPWIGRWGLDEKACEKSFDARPESVVEFTLSDYFEKDHSCEMFENSKIDGRTKIVLKCWNGNDPYFVTKIVKIVNRSASILTYGEIIHPDRIENRVRCD